MNSSQVTGECLTLPGTAREQSSLGVTPSFVNLQSVLHRHLPMHLRAGQPLCLGVSVPTEVALGQLTSSSQKELKSACGIASSRKL